MELFLEMYANKNYQIKSKKDNIFSLIIFLKPTRNTQKV